MLFEGDIGSGKSSILYAIEFAFFGLGELDARSVLRSSASSGKVELAFDVGGREYRVTRTIERKKGVRTTLIQTRGWIDEPDGRRTELSPTELRSRILQVLNFKEKQSAKASSRIYRYAVFTPQELMKEVLAQRAEDRLDTLRRAFGVEDYSFATANTGVVLSFLDTQTRVYSNLSANLPSKEQELGSKKKELTDSESELARGERELEDIQKRLEESNAIYNELEEEVTRINQTRALLPVLERNLSQLDSQLSTLKDDLEVSLRLKEEVAASERKLASLKQDYERYLILRDKLRSLEGLVEQARGVEAKITKLKDTISSKEANLKTELRLKEEEVAKLSRKAKQYEKDVARLGEAEREASELKTTAGLLATAQDRLEALKTEMGSASAMLSSEKKKIEDATRRIDSLDGISKESKCPLCGQALNEEHLSQVKEEYRLEIQQIRTRESAFKAGLEKLDSELDFLQRQRDNAREAQEKLEDLTNEIMSLQQLKIILSNQEEDREKIQASSDAIRADLLGREFAKESEAALREAMQTYGVLSGSLGEQQTLRSEYEKLEDARVLENYQRAESIVARKKLVYDQVERGEVRVKELDGEILKVQNEVREKKKDLEQGEPIVLQYARLKEEVKKLEGDIADLRIRVSVLSERVKKSSRDCEALGEQVELLRKYSAKLQYLSDVKSWLSEGFDPAITDIEKYVLASINEEFAHVFQRIFSILTYEEGDLSVTIDDRFAPIIEQGGYELEVQSLSGGERTAVALAYRLALNYMVKRANEALQANLLILDEPTEGFSKEQIYRFRNTLEELANDQVIIVSHERDLEPMADRVFRVEKQNGQSVVTAVSSPI